MKKTYIFLDTNIFLHYQFFENIKWKEIVGAKVIEIVLAPVTIKEIDNQKFQNPVSSIRNKSKKIISKIYDLMHNDLSSQLKDELYLTILTKEPEDIYFINNNLDRTVNDDRLLASILSFKDQHIDNDVILITADLGPILKSKSLDIVTIKMLDKYLDKNPIDAASKKIKNLERENLQLKNKLPRLAISFTNNDIKNTYCVEHPDEFSEIKLQTILDEIQKELIKQKEDKLFKLKNEPTNILSLIGRSLLFNDDTINRYDKSCKKYLSDYKEWVKKQLSYINILKRSLKIELLLKNTGTTPAEKIDVFLHFPDGFQLFSNNEFYKQPKKPEKPIFESTIDSINRMTPHLMIPALSNMNRTPLINKKNISSPIIKKSNSYDVSITVGYLKHYQKIELEPLFVLFEKCEIAKSFSINYKINAANNPNEITGKLNIIVNK